MGWLFMYEMGTRKAMIENLTAPQDWEKDGTKFSRRTLAHCYRGAAFAGVLYAVKETKAEGPEGVKTSRFIEVDLLRYSKTDGPGCWGYKDMYESMGPYNFSCPLKYLTMVECPDGYAADWREKVQAWWDRQREKRQAKRVA